MPFSTYHGKLLFRSTAFWSNESVKPTSCFLGNKENLHGILFLSLPFHVVRQVIGIFQTGKRLIEKLVFQNGKKKREMLFNAYIQFTIEKSLLLYLNCLAQV